MPPLSPGFSTQTTTALPLHFLTHADYPAWLQSQPSAQQTWLQAQGFHAAPGTLALLPGTNGLTGAVIGIGDTSDPFTYAHAPFGLPEGDWSPATPPAPEVQTALQLGWGLGAYRFDQYRQAPARGPARLALDAFDSEARHLLAAITRVRDLVNTPAEHMGPEHLDAIIRDIASAHHAHCQSIVGEALLHHNFPTIHAVGRASHRAPRLITLRWGEDNHPHVVIVGKGVCFDSGGLDMKSADGMRHMKKDMGGAAHALALAELIMARQLPLRLTLLIPAVDNALGPQSFRPGDILRTRKGLHVEVDNTDAEGRLVLCDALAYAGELEPDLILDFATLTGAARIALGPDVPALFCNHQALATALLDASQHQRDPLWRMPLWRPYLRYLASPVADLANAGSRMAGAITAALYLERFIPEHTPWAHLDVYAWNDHPRPGRPQGGEALGLRAVYALLRSQHFPSA